NSKRIKLEEYSDYDEAVRIQNYLSYKIGKIFVKNPFLFAIRLYFLKKREKMKKIKLFYQQGLTVLEKEYWRCLMPCSFLKLRIINLDIYGILIKRII
ncbi:hypothetical protein OLQ28_08395, partial [Campylobacter jejuni]|nr:hypothetical protein [Campylobacter jejuni]